MGYARFVETVLKAIAEPRRQEILRLIWQHERTAGDVAAHFDISRPAVSKHLRILRKAQLVREHRRGRHRLYQINPEPLRAVDSWLNDYRVFWRGRLEDLREFVEAKSAAQSQLSLGDDPERRRRNVKR